MQERNIVTFDELSSTNSYLSENCSSKNVKEFTIVTTEHQSAGRGQIGNTWHSARGENLLLSYLLKPTFLQAQDQFYLSMIISLGIRKSLESNLPNKAVTIKWPNDIYVNDKKICGLLIQNHLTGKILNLTIAGIGVNINQTSFPDELPNPTSLKLEMDRSFDREMLLTDLLDHIDEYYSLLKDGNLKSIKSEYVSNLYLKGKMSSFEVKTGGILNGRIAGVSDIGRLQIEKDEKIYEFGFREIKYM